MSSSTSSSSVGGDLDVTEFLARTTSLVALERQAEVEEEAAYKSTKNSKALEQAGVLLTRLVVTDVATGLYGRCLLTLEPARGGPLKQSELGVRDIVELSAQAPSGGGGGGSGAVGSSSGKITTGIVYRMKETSLTLVLDEFPDASDRLGQMSVLKLANQVTYDRYKFALDSLAKEFAGGAAATSVSSRLLRVLYADTEPVSSTRRSDWQPFSTKLNAQQKVAIQGALDANDVYMIHGPPGTGKTTTVVELIRQLVSRGLRVLACAPSNLAVDNLVEKLSEKMPMTTTTQKGRPAAATYTQPTDVNIAASSTGAFEAAVAASSAGSLSSSGGNTRGHQLRLIRLGHPARIIPSVLRHTLDSIAAESDAAEVCQGIREDISSLSRRLEKTKERAEKPAIRRELREAQKALREHERKAITESLARAEVICCTLVNCGSKLMDMFTPRATGGSSGGSSGVGHQGFDVVVIDEAAQALEVACLLPIMKGRKLILAGDNKQLGPTVKSKEAATGFGGGGKKGKSGTGGDGLEKTLFDRLVQDKSWGRAFTTMLCEQYRMHATIMTWCSDELYDSRLTGPPEVTAHLLNDLPGVKDTPDTRESFVVIDTAGLRMHEDEQPQQQQQTNGKGGAASLQQQRSKSNAAEAVLIRSHLEALIAAGVSPRAIALIAPYNGQVSLLREMLLEEYGPRGLEIGTVDGIQGREKEAILITMTRSNARGDVGFLAEDRRMNVAITRAKRHVCIVLDSSTITSHPFLARLVEYAADHGDYRMAEDGAAVQADASSSSALVNPTDGRRPGEAAAIEAIGGLAISAKGEASTPQHPIVTVPKPKAKHVRPSPASAAHASASTAASAVAAAAPPGPVEEEWPESRIEYICEDVLKKGVKLLAAASSASSAPSSSSSSSNSSNNSAAPAPVPAWPFFSFPPTLNSYERQLVHAVAERVSSSSAGTGATLQHESTGDGRQRYIVVRFVPTPAAGATKDSAATMKATTVTVQTATATATASAEVDADHALPSSATVAPSKKAAKKSSKKAADLAAAQAAQIVLQESRDDARRRALDAMERKAKGHVSAQATGAAIAASVAILAASEAAQPRAISSTPHSWTPTGAASASSVELAARAPTSGPSGFAALAAAEEEDDETAAADEEAEEPAADEDAAVNAAAGPSAWSKNQKKKKAAAKAKAASAAPAASAASGAAPGAAADDDFDSMLAEFSGDVCKSVGCDARVRVLGFTCAYCKERYCGRHMNPVVHGCAAAHKQFQLAQSARALHHEQKGTRATGMRDHERAALQAKLDKKIQGEKKERTKQLEAKKKDEKKK